jgi:hypothetical protein
LKLYADNGTTWDDVTATYMPSLDRKAILNKIKDKYKKDYKDLELYNNKGYETSDDIFRKAIIFNITAEGKIIMKDQYIDYPLFEMVWDAEKTKFEFKKIKD